MDCRCNEVDEFHGQEAEDYTAHLVRDETNAVQMTELYSCPDTGSRWVLDWPERTEREPGQARLRLDQ
jgi:hypothetical protein